MAKHMDLYGERMDALNARVAAECEAAGHKEVLVFYSAYETDGNDLPVDNLDEVPWAGTFNIASDPYSWVQEGHDHYESPPLTNPTWLDIAVAANAAILATGDHHHIFLENVRIEGNKLNMVMGS